MSPPKPYYYHPHHEIKESGFIDRLFKPDFKQLRENYEDFWKNGGPSRPAGLKTAKLIIAGDYPKTLGESAISQRIVWFRDYMNTLIQHEVPYLANIKNMDILPELMTLIAQHTSKLINISSLAKPLQVSRPTMERYISIMANTPLLDQLPAWHGSNMKRQVKTNKIHIGDTGLACALMQLEASILCVDRQLFASLLETFVYQRLKKQASWQDHEITFSHFRNKDNLEAHIVLERQGQIAAVCIKAAASMDSKDFRGLRKLQAETGNKFAAGVVLYNGTSILPFGPKMYCMPVSTVWA